MINFILPFLLFLSISIAVNAQSVMVPKRGVNKITSEELYKTMSVLTSDSLDGRAPGTPGGDKAAAYIEQQFKANGLKPFYGDSYRQKFMLYGKEWKDAQLSVNGKTISGNNKIYYLGNHPVDEPEQKELVYIGNADDSLLSLIDLTNKMVLVNLNQLTRSYGIINKLEAKGAWGALAFTSVDSVQFNNAVSFNTRMRGLIGMNQKKPLAPKEGLRLFILNNNQIPEITGLSVNDLVKKQICSDSLITVKVTIHSPILIKEVTTWNIAGVIKGTNPLNKPVAVTAHYDHVGRKSDGICRGADDNASGVSAIIQVADAYNGLKKNPDRDILFIAFGAEELGLIGSAFFMKEFKREDFYANINVDMIGRRDTISKENYVYIMGTDKNQVTHALHQEANRQTVNLNLDYSYCKASGFGSMMNRSDHYNFYKKDIPVISFFSGLHGDYHTPLDTIEKIDFPLMTRRVQLIFATLYLLVNSESLGN